ncbi:MAG: sulfite exporter TauE/SafE family protein, partial [Gammaproteobacteria bacterium]
MDIAFAVAGFIVGFIVGLTGVGGGSLMTPVLVILFGIKPAIAVGTDLLYAAITKSGGIFVHHYQKSIDWKIVGLLSSGSIPATLAALFLLGYLENSGIEYDRLITLVLSIALILTSAVLLFKQTIQTISQNERFDSVRALHHQLRTPITIL